MQHVRKQTRKEKTNDLSSFFQSRTMVSFLSLLLVLLALPVATFLVRQGLEHRLDAAGYDSGRVEAESASPSGSVTTGYDANASGTSTTANYIQFTAPTGMGGTTGNLSTLLPDTTSGIHLGLPFDHHTNPSTYTGRVDYIWGASYPQQPPAGVFHTFYLPYDRDEDTRLYKEAHDITWWQANHPDWVEYKCDKTTVAYEFGETTTVPLDITNPNEVAYMEHTYVDAGLQGTLLDHPGEKYDGIAFDNPAFQNAGDGTGQRCGHWDASHTVWTQQFNGTSNDPAYRQAIITWTKNMQSYMHSHYPNNPMSENFSFDFSFPTDSNTLLSYIDIDNDEQGFTNGNNASASNPKSWYYTDSQWVQKMQALQTFMSNGPKGWYPNNQEPVSFANLTNDQVQWALANYLLIKNNTSYLSISGYQEYGYLLIRPEYAAPIGSPTNAYYALQNVYMRDFTGGLVIVNPSSSTQYTVSLPSGKYKDLYGNTIGTSYTLPVHSGVVLQLATSTFVAQAGSTSTEIAKTPTDISPKLALIEAVQTVNKASTQRQAVLAATNPITGTSLSSPAGIGVVSSQSQVWVANRGNSTISVFDYNGTLLKTLSGNGLSAPYEPTVVGNQVWVPNSGNSTISVFNPDGTAAGVGPYSGNSLSTPKGMMVVGTQVWVENDGNSTISRFNVNGTSAGTALTGIANPRGGVVVSVNGTQRAWIPSHAGSIYRLDTNGNQVAATITGNSLANVESLGLVGSQIWAPDAGGSVSTFNPDGSAATGSPVTDGAFSDIHGVAQIGSQVWIPDTGSNAISIVAAPAGGPTPTAGVTPTPTSPAGGVTVTPSPTGACAHTLPSGTGVATTSITIPSTGSYALWTRMMVPSSTANSYYLQVDSGCPYLVSDTTGTNSWNWVSSAPITLALATGSHTITMVGNQAGVKVDELIFSQSCTPTGTGDACFSTSTPTPTPQQQTASTYPSGIKHVFVVVMENTDWSQIKGNTNSAPYINGLLSRSDASYASNYHNVTPSEVANGYLHPSEPNYIWLEGGTNSFTDHTYTNDNDATSGNYTTSTNHLTTLLQNKGLSWKAYEESMPSGCPITSSGNYAAKHNPLVFFTDVSGNPPSATNTNCSSHVVPFTQLATDLQNNTVPSYSFITPNLCDDMHSNSCSGSNDPIHQGDTWLSTNLPTLLNSAAYKNGGAVFLTWDEDSGSTTNNPIGMIVLSPLAKGNGYTNTTLYSHSSFVKTAETIFGLSPLLAHASSATDLSDLFVTSGGLTSTPTPSPRPTPTNTPPPAFLAQDTFQRPNQTYWRTASNGMIWGGDANSSSSFSINNNAGLIKPSSAADLHAVLGSSVANAEVLMSGSMTALGGRVNSLGVVLRWSNKSNYYRAVITGRYLVIQRVVNGSTTKLKSTSFPASPNTSYIIRFNANGTTLSVKAWQTGTIEPANWMVTATDSTFSSGQCGIRTYQQGGSSATITSFQAKQL